jgi:hypothetical protein
LQQAAGGELTRQRAHTRHEHGEVTIVVVGWFDSIASVVSESSSVIDLRIIDDGTRFMEL